MNEQQGSGDAGTLLLVDDDPPFLNRLARAMERRGFDVRTAGSVADGKAAVDIDPPDYAVVDLRLGDGSGVDVVSHLQAVRPESRAIILTGYGNIATAVAAVKVGAIDYLPKPADADAIETALKHMGADPPGPRNCRCRPTACAGSISSASTSSAGAMSRKPRAGCACTAARSSASSPNTRRGNSRPSPFPLAPDRSPGLAGAAGEAPCGASWNVMFCHAAPPRCVMERHAMS